MLVHEYARSGLQLGLQIEADLGTNPYKFGMIGSTDSHTSLATADDDNFFGKHSGSEPGPHRMEHPLREVRAGLRSWAGKRSPRVTQRCGRRKTRARRCSTPCSVAKPTRPPGPRMLVRFFGGWDFEAADANTRQPAALGYRKGVPMGWRPEFGAARSIADIPDCRAQGPGRRESRSRPGRQGLDRRQWQSPGANLRTLRCRAGARSVPTDAPARPSAIPSTSRMRPGAIRSGRPELITVWTDPEFDASLRAFYYVRVLEIPTPRWSAYDAKYYGVELAADDPGYHQERAYTSPIWYTPLTAWRAAVESAGRDGVIFGTVISERCGY